jgi:hypothetical protein
MVVAVPGPATGSSAIGSTVQVPGPSTSQVADSSRTDPGTIDAGIWSISEAL